jgi:hypothetical protein
MWHKIKRVMESDCETYHARWAGGYENGEVEGTKDGCPLARSLLALSPLARYPSARHCNRLAEDIIEASEYLKN